MRRTILLTLVLTAAGSPPALVAQSPAVTNYNAAMPSTPTLSDLMGIGGYGYFFSTNRNDLLVSALSVFNPAFAGGGSSLGGTALGWPLSGSYTVYLQAMNAATVTTNGWNLGQAATSALVDGTSIAKPVSAGPGGAFWTTALATPYHLTANQIYAVFAVGNSNVPANAVGNNSPPTTDSRITYLQSGVGYAGGYGVYAYDANQLHLTGGSLEISVLEAQGLRAAAASVTPEPATLGLLGTGLLGIVGTLWRRRPRSSAAV